MSQNLVNLPSPAERIILQFSGDADQFGISTDLPDLAFLRKLSIQGRLRFFQDSGFSTSITITPPDGETFFFYKATAKTTTNDANTLSVVNDGNTRYSNTLGSITAVPTEINFIDSLVGNGTKTFVVATTDDGNLSVFGWVENTSRIRGPTI